MTPGKKTKRPAKKRIRQTERRSQPEKAPTTVAPILIPPLLGGVVVPPILLEGDNPPVPLKQKPKPEPPPVPPAETKPATPSTGSLPLTYDTKHLLLIAQDPHWLYAQWDFSRSDLIRYTQVASDGHLRLRLFKEEVAGHPMLEVVVGREALHQFVPVAEAGAKYLATLGYYLGDGSWVTLCTSEKVAVPHDLPSILNPLPVQAVPPASPEPKLESFLDKQSVSDQPVLEDLRAPEAATFPSPLLEQPSAMEETKKEESFKPFEMIDADLDAPQAPSTPSVFSEQAEWQALAQDPEKWAAESGSPLLAAAAGESRPIFQEPPSQNGQPQEPLLRTKPEHLSSTITPEPSSPYGPPVEVVHQVLQKYLFDFLTYPVSSAERPQQPPVAELAKGPEQPPAPEVLPLPPWFISGSLPGISSPQARVLPPQPGKEFWFQVNAELVIYGKTMPNALVQIAGRSIRLRPDGTFSYRFSLPDGHYHLPIQATSPDGVDTRQARLSFQRQSDYAGYVQAMSQDPGLKPPHPEHL